MNMQHFRDRHGNRIGHTLKVGFIEIGYLRSGERVGHYDPNVNVTYHAGGTRAGFGNLLGTLIMKDSL